MRNQIDYDPEKFEKDSHGNLYPLDADSRYGHMLEDEDEEVSE